MILPVIMAGGTGSRLWPLSRDFMPKQFLKFNGDDTMLQTTVKRLSSVDVLDPLVICNEEHRFIAAEQLRQINQLNNNIILEPVARNTAPAIALAALTSLKNGQDPLLLVLAADHVISDTQAFDLCVAKAQRLAMNGKLVTFGIVPTHPETGYGYIHRGKDEEGAYTVNSFVEKPDIARAQQYIADGEYYWNSGMFMFKASLYLDELKKHRP